jgi:histidinol-phosphatase
MLGKRWRVNGFAQFTGEQTFSRCTLFLRRAMTAEPEVSVWDLAALDIVVRESGGAFTSLSGREGPHGGTVVATNGLLQLAVLDRLNGG